MEIGAVLDKGGKGGQNKPQVTCFNCGKQGHRAADCWSPKPTVGKDGKKGGKGGGKTPGGGKHPAGGKDPAAPKGGKGGKGKGKTKDKKGKGKGKSLCNLEESEYDGAPEELWPGDGEPVAEIGSLFALETCPSESLDLGTSPAGTENDRKTLRANSSPSERMSLVGEAGTP